MPDASIPRRVSWLRRGLLAVAVVAAWVILLRLDVPIMRWGRGSGVFPEDPRGWTEQFLLGLRDFGQILPVIVTCIVVGALN